MKKLQKTTYLLMGILIILISLLLVVVVKNYKPDFTSLKWRTYKNEGIGIVFKYPRKLTISEHFSSTGVINDKLIALSNEGININIYPQAEYNLNGHSNIQASGCLGDERWGSNYKPITAIITQNNQKISLCKGGEWYEDSVKYTSYIVGIPTGSNSTEDRFYYFILKFDGPDDLESRQMVEDITESVVVTQ